MQADRPPSIDQGRLAELIAAGTAFVVDVRRHTGSEQIYGSIRYNPRHLLEAERLLLPLPKEGETPIVLYDETGAGPDLVPLSEKFRRNGYAGIRVLEGGFEAWKVAARRTEPQSFEQPIPGVDEQQLER